MSLILVPFSWLLNTLNGIFNSYGIAIIIFAVFVKIILFPFSIKGKKGMIAMNMISGEMAKLKKQYGKDPQRYNQEVQDLYVREKVNPLSGCLWTLLPLFVLLPLYTIIRQPVEYIIGLNETQLYDLANALNWDAVSVELGMITQDLLSKAQESNFKDGIHSGFQNTGYNQLFLASLIPEAGITLSDGTLVEQMNFHMAGIDLTKVPNWKLWQDFSLQNIATLVLVALSACSGILFSRISQKTNKASNPNMELSPQQEQTNKMMMYMMPITSIWIGLIMPSIMVVYWIANNLLAMVQEMVAGQILKKDYEEMRIKQEQRALAEKEEEKRLKAEKVKEIERRKEELSKNKGKKKKKAKPTEPTDEPVDKSASREGMRSYARGRAYDPNRYPNPNGETEESNITQGEPIKALEETQIPEDEGYDTVLLSSKQEEELEDVSYETQEELETSHSSTATEEEKASWEEQKQKLKEDLEQKD